MGSISAHDICLSILFVISKNKFEESEMQQSIVTVHLSKTPKRNQSTNRAEEAGNITKCIRYMLFLQAESQFSQRVEGFVFWGGKSKFDIVSFSLIFCFMFCEFIVNICFWGIYDMTYSFQFYLTMITYVRL